MCHCTSGTYRAQACQLTSNITTLHRAISPSTRTCDVSSSPKLALYSRRNEAIRVIDLSSSKEAKTTNDTDQVQLKLGNPGGRSHSGKNKRILSKTAKMEITPETALTCV